MQIRKEKAFWVVCVLLILNILFIWGNSLLAGNISSALSNRVLDVLRLLLHLPSSDSVGAGGHWIRKIAHFLEFCMLGILSGTFFWKIRGKIFSSAALLSLLTACVDETIQRFVEGRSSSVLDVWIDFSGALLGILTIVLICVWKTHTNWRKNK